jgi:hypothetical protein
VWGSERAVVYNEVYTPMLGDKRPWAFGRSFCEVRPELRDPIEPVIEAAFAGQTSFFEDPKRELVGNGGRQSTAASQRVVELRFRPRRGAVNDYGFTGGRREEPSTAHGRWIDLISSCGKVQTTPGRVAESLGRAGGHANQRAPCSCVSMVTRNRRARIALSISAATTIGQSSATLAQASAKAATLASSTKGSPLSAWGAQAR